MIRSLLTISLLLAISLGCSPKSDLMRVTGDITYKGKPVPKGRIELIPDATSDTKSAMGFALIEEGHFDTANEGRGVAPGKYMARIQGFDGVRQGDDISIYGALLFEPVERAVTVDASDSPITLSLD